MLKSITITLLILVASNLNAQGVYQTPDAFINVVFNNKPPKAKKIWLTGDKRKVATDILKHKPTFLRTRYWQQDTKTVWILDEIGKEKPITVGIVINNHTIERVKVLAFRESRGWEVKHTFFTDQFKHATLKDEKNLSKTIDGITGATLSVRALTKLSRLALYLDTQVPAQ